MRCVRVLIHWNTDKSPREVRHAYLRNSRLLRPDWAIPPLGGAAGHLTAPERPELEAEQASFREEGTPPAAPVVVAQPEPPAAVKKAPAHPTRAVEIAPVAFLGDRGTYSHEAVLAAFGADTAVVPCDTFRHAFDAVHDGRAHAALVPVENSTAGSIHEVYDLLLARDLRILAEVVLPVHHALMARPGTRLADIQTVLSHPQGLSQCDGWIAKHRWTPRTTADTASAARLVAASEEPGLAAIGSRLAAELNGLEIVARDVQDVSENYTRFLLLVPPQSTGPGRVAPGFLPAGAVAVEGDDARPSDRPIKTSIIFATRHVAGDLYACLAEFAVRELNLTKIESRPDRRTPWHYLFYLDFEGDVADQKVAQTLRSVERHASFLRVLGSYPSRLLT
ncbi:MAG: prephenate dehydratase [Deltaproteobacteria bacterium]|nr:MAG: prephenate dehydratase [Deltaproteobacteria bacterium]